ncbi:MAG TPA: uroporphyrinogen decarboxylase family protein, partial [Actinopolymorphaceae bacterium]
MLRDTPFLRACQGEPVPYTPIWFMRQAGRSLPEYRKLREGIPMLESCRRPDLVTEITLQPVRRYGVDAAIFYSDIMVPLAATGFDLDIVPGVGPVVPTPVRDKAGLDALRPLDPSDVPYVTEAIGQLVAELGSTPLIGFAGGPFTLASYLVEGGPSRDHAATKTLMHADPELWHALAGRLAEIASTFLRVQVEAGASAVQLFDSWAGALSPADYQTYVMPHSRRILEEIGELGVPRIH